MTLSTALKIGKDCNAKTISQVLQIIAKNKNVLFEYSDGKSEMRELIQEIKRNGLSMRDRVDLILNKDKNSQSVDWWKMVC